MISSAIPPPLHSSYQCRGIGPVSAAPHGVGCVDPNLSPPTPV